MAVRILLVVAVLAISYGCGQSSSQHEQGNEEGDKKPNSATPLGTGQQATTQQETALLHEVAGKKIAFGSAGSVAVITAISTTIYMS